MTNARKHQKSGNCKLLSCTDDDEPEFRAPWPINLLIHAWNRCCFQRESYIVSEVVNLVRTTGSDPIAQMLLSLCNELMRLEIRLTQDTIT